MAERESRQALHKMAAAATTEAFRHEILSLFEKSASLVRRPYCARNAHKRDHTPRQVMRLGFLVIVSGAVTCLVARNDTGV